MTSGTPLWAFAAGVAVSLAICTVNVLSAMHDRPSLRLWEVASWEYSSGIVTVLLLPLAARAVVLGRSPATGGWARFAAVHGGAAVLYSLLHVGGFVVLRKTAYLAIAGWTYRFGGFGEWVYEFRKDALSYTLIASLFAFARSRAPVAPPARPRPQRPRRSTSGTAPG